MKINKLLESNKMEKGYSHFEYTSGANPYIAKTKDEVDRIKRSRGDSVRYVGNINGIDYYKVYDSEEDLFRVDESKQLNETEYGKDELWNQINNNEWAYNTLANKVKTGIENGTPKERIVNIVRNAIASMRNDFGRIPTTQAERLELARDFVEDELQGYSFEDGDPNVLSYKRTGTWSKLGEAFTPSDSGIQSVKCYNRYNYTIQELRIDNDNKTFERGNFTAGKADKKTKNRQEFEDIVDNLIKLGYNEIKSDYRSMRNKSRKGIPTNESKESEESELITQYINNGEFDKLEKVHNGTNVVWKLKEPIKENSEGFQKEFYNGYVILKNRAGDGWDIYSYDGTPEKVTKAYLEDEGYATLKDAKAEIDKWTEESKLDEAADYKVKFFQVFEAPKSPKENGKMIGQRGTLDDANAFGKEKVGEGNYIIKAVCDDGQTRPIDNDTKTDAFKMVEESVDTVTRYKVEYYIDDGERLETYIYADSNDECELKVKEKYPNCTITACIPETVPASYKENDLNEASYGGAFDIMDDEFWTRDDLNKFAEEVMNHINEIFHKEYRILGAWSENGNIIVSIGDEEGNEYETTKRIDMRKIRKPSDLTRHYAGIVVYDLRKQIEEVEGINESVDDDDDGLELDFQGFGDYYDYYDDGEVDEGKNFFEDGREFVWVKRHGDVVHLDFDNWAVWEAKDVDSNESEYFVVDEDTMFIDWGPCATVSEAQEFLNSKQFDWDSEFDDETYDVDADVIFTEDE